MSRPSILVAGIGNIFLGDDGFGVEVVRRLAQRPQPAHVRLVDFGIRGLDLAYALLEPYQLVVLVDIVQRGSPPGTVHAMELIDETSGTKAETPDTHGVVPSRAIKLARELGATMPRLLLVGCEPADFGDPEAGEITLSPAVAAAIEPAIAAIDRLLAEHGAFVPSCTSSA